MTKNEREALASQVNERTRKMGIEISVKTGADAAISSVSASGSVQHIITDTDRVIFGIQDAPLKNAVGKYFGRNPEDAFLHSPTPWGDLYKMYGWSQVVTILDVKSATITGITSEPIVVKTVPMINTSSTTRGTFHTDISDEVAFTTESNWSKTDTIEEGLKITYEYKFPGESSVGGETTLSYSHSWGEGGSESKSIAVGSDTGVSVDLDPGEAVVAELSASKGVMKVRIVYRAYVTGYVAVNYDKGYKGHHYWALGIGKVMRAAGLSNTREYTEDIEIGYYANSKVEIRDAKGRLRASFFDTDKPAV